MIGKLFIPCLPIASDKRSDVNDAASTITMIFNDLSSLPHKITPFINATMGENAERYPSVITIYIG